MQIITSAMRAPGVLTIAHLADNARLEVRFPDEPTPRDMTGYIADFTLSGALEVTRAETSPEDATEDEEEVVAAVVTFVRGSAAPMFTWVNVQTGEAGTFPVEDAPELMRRGVSALLVDGIRHEVRRQPDTQDTPLSTPPTEPELGFEIPDVEPD